MPVFGENKIQVSPADFLSRPEESPWQKSLETAFDLQQIIQAFTPGCPPSWIKLSNKFCAPLVFPLPSPSSLAPPKAFAHSTQRKRDGKRWHAYIFHSRQPETHVHSYSSYVLLYVAYTIPYHSSWILLQSCFLTRTPPCRRAKAS